jgi:hypothetical protein
VIGCRRPRPVESGRLDGLYIKAIRLPSQRERALAAQAIAIDHGGRTVGRRAVGRHDQRGPLAIIGQRVRPYCKSDKGSIRQRQNAAKIVA